MKSVIKKITKKIGVYDNIRWSKSYLFLYSIINFKYNKIRRNEAIFFRELIPRNCLCFDIGANIGSKTYILLKMKCKVICVEPVKRNTYILQRRYKGNNNVVIISGSVSDHIGHEEVFVTEENLAFSTFSRKWLNIIKNHDINRWGMSIKSSFTDIVETRTLDSLIEKFGLPYYIKIDVEGYEVKVIKGLTKKIPLISFEANLPEFLEETKLCVSYLSSIDIDAKFNYISDTFCFENETWLNHRDFNSFLDNQKLRYMEIFCKMRGSMR